MSILSCVKKIWLPKSLFTSLQKSISRQKKPNTKPLGVPIAQGFLNSQVPHGTVPLQTNLTRRKFFFFGAMTGLAASTIDLGAPLIKSPFDSELTSLDALYAKIIGADGKDRIRSLTVIGGFTHLGFNVRYINNINLRDLEHASSFEIFEDFKKRSERYKNHILTISTNRNFISYTGDLSQIDPSKLEIREKPKCLQGC